MVASLQSQPDGPVVEQVPLEDIATHPDNRPHSGIGDVADLAASIRAMGVLEPVLLTPAEAYLAARPDHSDVIGDRPWVLIAGERRHAATSVAGLATIPAIVRADLTGAEGLSAMVAENMHRLGMHPLDEAALFSLQANLGATQRQIAERTGCSQAHVSKRMALLRLPQPVQDALGTGQIDLTDAQALGRLAAADQSEAWRRHHDDGVPVAAAAAAVADERRQQDAEARLGAEVEAEGHQLIDAAEMFGEHAEEHRLSTEDAVHRAATDGQLLVDVHGGHRRHYRAVSAAVEEAQPQKRSAAATGNPRKHSPTAPAQVENAPAAAASPSSDEQAERVRARTARHRSCVRACTGRPNAAMLHDGLLQATLWRADLGAHAVVELAGQFLHEADKGAPSAPPASVGAGDDWLLALRGSDDDLVQRRAGWALLLAARELRARETHRAWDGLDARHLTDLTTVAGHRPTAWEQARLDAAAAPALSQTTPSTSTQPLEEQ
jgi:ParB family chromosome partitioning protein